MQCQTFHHGHGLLSLGAKCPGICMGLIEVDALVARAAYV